MAIITSVEDLRRIAQRRVPKMFYQYVDSGSWTEHTYRANETDLANIALRQRVGIDMVTRSTASSMLGIPVAMPVALAPTGLTGMTHADGEILAARAAKRFGIPFALSTMSICSMEDVAHATDGHPFWFQLYMMKDRDFVGRLIERAAAIGCPVLMVTLDVSVPGQRHNDVRNGLSAPPRMTPRNLIDIATKPRWALGMMRTKRRTFGNIIGHVEGVNDLRSLAAASARQISPSLSWSDIAWIREKWKGRLVLKGIMDVEDAHRAVELGADCVVVSNHGGRQLDGAESAIRALPRIVQAVGNRIEVHMDSGIRSGQDVFKARALGAKAVYIGRAYLYGLGAMGEAGVTKVLEIIRRELDYTLALSGISDIEGVDASALR